MRLALGKVNLHLVCSLCQGYYRDAHTVPECLHTFCKECILREFGRGSRTCPTCGISLGANPDSRVVYDRNLQSCVDKLFPEFAERERIDQGMFNRLSSNIPDLIVLTERLFFYPKLLCQI